MSEQLRADQELICEWMGWPDPIFGKCVPGCLRLTLDLLHEVEARLTEEQWRHYAMLIFVRCCREARTTNAIEDQLTVNRKGMIHADAPTKTRALASVLRSR